MGFVNAEMFGGDGNLKQGGIYLPDLVLQHSISNRAGLGS